MSTKEADLTVAVLTYACNCIAEGDLHMLMKLGLERADIEALKGISLGDLRHLRNVRGQFLKTTIDRDVLARTLTHIKRMQAEQIARDRLMALDAPLALMRIVCGGMSDSEYAGLRKLHGFNGVGRPRAATEKEEQAVWRTLQSLGKDGDALHATDWLLLHERSQVPLRIIWSVVQDLIRQREGFAVAEAVA